MYLLSKEFRFEASHRLENHDGKCFRLHGHSWKGCLFLRGNDALIKSSGCKKGMLIDYGDISAAFKPIVDEYLDHWHLNDTLRTDSPTSEFIAKWIYDKLKPVLPMLVAVRIEETCTSAAEYWEEG